MEVQVIAEVCHQANRVIQRHNGDLISLPWDEESAETRASVVDGVQNVISGATPEQSHENWLQFTNNHGWRYGAVKDEEAKTHPLIVPYADLPPEQKVKDALFVGIVKALSEPYNPNSPLIAREQQDEVP